MWQKERGSEPRIFSAKDQRQAPGLSDPEECAGDPHIGTETGLFVRDSIEGRLEKRHAGFPHGLFNTRLRNDVFPCDHRG